ncbi:DNA-binding transcriptional regulator YhcF (GntR family) [Texcoconibacillus texcoconensis]|uniref:DNA-binding transcriptional regulator YhcF (GntR family) n=1 Tax=Texcoconibacillus texcoconensis TaxID=1095777 RepID=A0A840QPH2_9BACI|nr:DNA-binding transcriptional regulator YhcF (GntR family) [Texcoconibacillus texcoconensis]
METEILSGHIEVDEKMYSQYQLADMFNINPATAAKGLNLLADANIVYKKRGLGMFVSSEAKALIIDKRKSQTLGKLVKEIVKEANYLNVSEEELVEMVRVEMREKGDSR